MYFGQIKITEKFPKISNSLVYLYLRYILIFQAESCKACKKFK